MTAILNYKFNKNTSSKEKPNKDIFSYEEVLNIKKRHNEEIEELSKLLVSRDLELRKINDNLDDKIVQLKKSNERMEDNKDVLTIRLNAKTRQLKEVIDALDEKVKKRTKKIENSQKALMNILDDYKIEKESSQTERNRTVAIIKNMSDGILIFNKNNILTTVNKMAIKLLALKNIKEATELCLEELKTPISEFSGIHTINIQQHA